MLQWKKIVAEDIQARTCFLDVLSFGQYLVNHTAFLVIFGIAALIFLAFLG